MVLAKIPLIKYILSLAARGRVYRQAEQRTYNRLGPLYPTAVSLVRILGVITTGPVKLISYI